MPIITSIKPQKNKKRVNIYLDEKFAFGLDLEVYMKRGLKVEQVLTEEQISSIIKEGEFQTTYDKMLRYATIRPRSEKEFNYWLKKHKVHKSIHEELFNRLKHLDLLDDEKFASWWIEQRQNFRPKSKRVLVQELRMKGIDRDVINKVLKNSSIDELKVAKDLVNKKKYKWEKFDGFEKRKKTYGYLAQKGFSSEVIREIISDIVDN